MSGQDSTLTCEQLRELLNYDTETGIFTWAKKRKGASGVGTIAGMLRHDGYWIIRLYKKLYLAHRLAWLYVTGQWSIGDIDHINGNRSDNRICNLRNVTRSVNLQNQRCTRSNNKTSSSLGVCETTSHYKKRWKASLQLNGKTVFCKFFYSEEEARAAYLEAKRKYHPGCTI